MPLAKVCRRLGAAAAIHVVVGLACVSTNVARPPEPPPAPRVSEASPPAPSVVEVAPSPGEPAQPPADAEKSSLDLATVRLQPGAGTQRPANGDFVEVHYTAWTSDGQLFAHSRARRQPVSLAIGSETTGWRDALRLMVEGEKRRVWLSQGEGYFSGRSDPLELMTVDVELVAIRRVREAGTDLTDDAPPADATRTESGLATKVLRAGTGTAHPTPTSRVKVLYTGWTTNGWIFDGTFGRTEPAVFPLDDVIPGWTEGVQLMTVGEKRRLWIPQQLAYKGQEGAPQGMLVFDVELLGINPP